LSGLFTKLYLDEDVDVLLANLVRARGFEVITTVEASQRGKTDVEQMAFAVSQQRALLTHNRADFEQIAQEYFAAGETHFGILIAVRRPTYEMARRVLVILNAITADEMQNQVRYI
jgi:predicted nuclease of predicted toxin-antitoxin system